MGAGGQAGGGGQVGPVGLTDGGMGVGRGGGHVETGSGGRTDGGGVGQVGVGGVGVGRYEWRRPSGMVAIVVVVGLVAWNLAHLPPWVNPDGGYPAGLAAGERVDATLSAAGVSGDAVVLIRSLPDFKSTEAMAYPLAVIGRAFVAETPKGHAPGGAPPADADGSGGLIVLCDDRFAEAIGARCGGPAEDAAVAAPLDGWAPGPLLDRFEAAPDRWVSVYGPALDR